MNAKQWTLGVVLILLGFVLGMRYGGEWWGEHGDSADRGESTSTAERDILYWVAPMDPNFRRDGPGKSPMGMDLVPVYADSSSAAGDVVSIHPAVVQNLGVRSETVTRGRLWRRIDTVGYVGYNEDLLSHIHLRTDGWIESLRVRSVGERVRRGDVLFELYSPDLVNAQEEFLQALKAGNSYLKSASRQRLQALGMSEAQVRGLESSRKVSRTIRILAGQDGIVDRLNVREGMYVKPATEVMSLADLSSVWLLADVFERQSGWVEVGMPAEVELSYLPGKLWKGEVEFVYPAIDPKTRTLRARLRFDNPGETLKPDMYAKVRIYAGPKQDVLSVPREALIRTGRAERVILALGDGRFRAQEVTSGMESGDWVEILSGIKEGEQVVTSGQFLIDSEASLKASFSRMGSDQPQAAGAFDGMGTVNEVFSTSRKLNLSHAPIEALGWPAMTMDLAVSDGVDLDALSAGAQIHFSLVKDASGNYRIDTVQVMEQ